MSLAELKTHAQELGLTKEKVAEFGDLRKKTTWELAIADFQSQIQPNCQPQAEISNEYTEKAIDLKQKHNLLGYDEQALAKVMELAAKEVGVQNEHSCMDAENAIADERLVNIPISFGKTLEQLLIGQKTVTRRLWADNYAHQFIKRFDEGRTIYPAFDKDRRYGGKQIGIIRLTCSPYKERLSDMPESDLEKEGFPEITQQEFISRFFCGDSDLEVWVVRFKFTPDEMNKNAFRSQTEPEATVSDNLFEPLVEPEVINITRESYPEIWQHLEPPTEPEAVPVSYQVITESPSIPPIYFSRPEQKRTVPKLPGQDFFVWLFSPPKVSVINQ